MKFLRLFLPIILILSMMLFSCTALLPDTDDTSDGSNNGSSSSGNGNTGDSAGDNTGDSAGDDGDEEAPVYNTISIADAIAEFDNGGNEFSTYLLKVTVLGVQNPTTGVLSVTDGTTSIKITSVYGYDSNGTRLDFADLAVKPKRGDQLIIKGCFNKEGNDHTIWKATILAHEAITLDEESILDVRGANVGADVTVDGVVAAITYSNGLNPSGIILVDETSSIYVYDKTVAESVKIGNKITVMGTKAYWVLEDEQVNAEKFGYKGSCQIEKAIVIENDGKINDFNKSWIEETSVMDLLSTPVTENITTKLYKVNALIKEVPGDGFTNFYFFDIDGITSTYAYTQCNGDDFTWLRAYDGKICTVYITALNAKSTSSDCYFRFLPVSVIDEGYQFDPADAPEYAVKYKGLTQLQKTYTGDPNLSLETEIYSDLLGFSGVELTFSSSNENVIKFINSNGSTTLTCPGYGTATVTVFARYGIHSYSSTIDITVVENQEIESLTVSEAIAAKDNETVTVKGIVGPSIIHANRRGFYLIDENGVIALSFKNAAELADIQIGNEVIITGTRATIDGTQIAIDNAELVANYYGSNSIPTSAITKVDSISSVSATKNTTAIFELKGKPEFIDGQWSDTYNISGVQLYSSNGATQYKLLSDYVGEEITVLITVCNWNGKNYKPCCVAVITDDGYVFNEYGFGR